MDENSITRVHYFARQFLRTNDFTDEQAYHIAMRRRHNLAHHSRGIVRGLWLHFDAEAQVFMVNVGVAIDGYGREVILPEAQPIATRIFDDRAAESIDVFLEYRLEANDRLPSSDCADQDDDDAISFYRWRESFRLTYEPADLDATDQSIPRAVPEGDRDFDATRTPPDTDQRRWPVFLGSIQRSEGAEIPYSVSLAGRTYAGLVGAELRRADDMAQISLTAKDGKAQFVVSTRSDPDNTPRERFKIDGSGNIAVSGETTIHGDVHVNGGLWAFGRMASGHSMETPWKIYVVDSEEQVDNPQGGTGSGGQTVMTTAMRIELGNRPPGQGDYQPRLAIGTWSEDEKKFKHILTINPESTDGQEPTVIISGTLIAKGFTDDAEIPSAPVAAAMQALQAEPVNRTLLNTIETLLNEFVRNLS
jgi:hypothetical protein